MALCKMITHLSYNSTHLTEGKVNKNGYDLRNDWK